jgi:dihydroxyacetone kinase
MKRGALAVQSSVMFYPLDDLSATFKALGHTLRRELGGSSGPLYGAFFLRCGSALGKSGCVSLAQWAEALKEGCDAISELGDAKPGDRTMLDAIYPFVMSLKSAGPDVKREILAATGEAQRGVRATAQMIPRRGRSRYLQDRLFGYPDPGAKAVAILLSAITGALFPS